VVRRKNDIFAGQAHCQPCAAAISRAGCFVVFSQAHFGLTSAGNALKACHQLNRCSCLSLGQPPAFPAGGWKTQADIRHYDPDSGKCEVTYWFFGDEKSQVGHFFS
jgi:hypothetical protein